ncbi:Dihydroneopterin aldolase [Candidatus Cyrtobacter comes]|uniref:dihydroneopterin aldolase n=1 Tax=Candidatus Cyrtobacter comes TaxID=675776 RepID=A0ABU5L7K7_9RICK|nr:dihydroneopterin aldolase [Candidatus Cyrtobacter comes]MDZ5762111.1 Dihydroneopterin aldolase [Candidatus Cyrtobacter comes]
MCNTSNNYVIKDIKLYLYIGVSQEERLQIQEISIDLTIFNLRNTIACMTDEIKDTFCYKELIESIIKRFNGWKVSLLERFGQLIYEHIKGFLNDSFKISITVKKTPAIDGFSGQIDFTIQDQ